MNIGLHGALIALIKSVIKDERLNPSVKELLTGEFLNTVFRLADFHDLSHVVCLALKKEGIEAPELFNKKELVAKQRYSLTDYEIERLKNLFNDQKIQYILLKGATLRNVYPDKYLRSCCDIDVLVKEDDVERASKIMCETLGVSDKKVNQHDISLITDSGVNIELHFALGRGAGENANEVILKSVWKNAKKVSEFEYALDDQTMNAYLIFHTAKHFTCGGTGVKPFIDLYVLNKYCGFSCEIGKELLKKIKLYQFARYAYQLMDVWFNDKESSPTLNDMARFVIEGGVYGTLKQKTEIEVASNKNKYFIRRIFLPYSQMKLRYKVLQKHAYLLPFYHIKRLFSCLSLNTRKRIKLEMEYKNGITKERAVKTEKLLNDLGL